MNNQLVFAVLSGLVSAALYAALLTRAPLALILFYVAPLPLALATLRFGWSAGAVGAGIGTVGVGIALGLNGAAFYAATSAGPMVWLARLAMLSRPATGGEPAAVPAGGSPRIDDTRAEWYPPGRIVIWTAALAGVLAAAALLMLGPDAEAFRASLRKLADALLSAQPGLVGGEASMGDLVDLLAVAVLPATSAIWLLVNLFNLWLAARILRGAGRLARPWPDLRRLDYPPAAAYVFLGALLLSFAPGFLGTLAPGVAAAFFVAYVLLGLAVLHSVLTGTPARTALLVLTYGLIVVLVWPAVVVAILGLGEPMFKLRARALARPRSPRD